MRILITGAGGFIGSHLVDKCKRDGHFVIGLDRKKYDLESNNQGEWSWTTGEFVPDEVFEGKEWDLCNDPRDLINNHEYFPFDLVYHLAAESRIQPSFDKPIRYIGSNILGTTHILEWAREIGAKVVYAGSSTADDDTSKNVYATTKHVGEQLCKTWHRCFDLPVSIARFYNVYGPRHISEGDYATVIGIWERQMKAGEKLTITGDGSQRRDFTHVDDIVDGLVAIAEKGDMRSKTYKLGTGKNYSLLEVAEMFVGRNSDKLELIPWRPGESRITQASYHRTKLDTGWKAKNSLSDYINQFLETLK